MTYRDACSRIGVLPGASQAQAIQAAERRLKESIADWRVEKTAITKAEDAVVEANEILIAISKGDEK